jgi:DNA-directed RNA polymerase subunit RPC12/RpoP
VPGARPAGAAVAKAAPRRRIEEPEPLRCPSCGGKTLAARCPGCGMRLRSDDDD